MARRRDRRNDPPGQEYYARPEEIIKLRQRTLLSYHDGINKRYWVVKVSEKWIPEKHKRESTIISLFNKTSGDIVCPHFWEFKPWTGCPFLCSYCYLQGTFRGANKKKPRLKDLDFAARVLEEFFQWIESIGLRTVLNTGEVADSLAVPVYVEAFLEKIIPILSKHREHRILFLTKGGTHHIKVLEKIPEELKTNFIASFSINPPAIAERYEKGAAHPYDRIEAASIAQKMGFEVRIRIDPIMPIEGWIAYYEDLVRRLLNKVNPSRITIGSLRGLQKTINFAPDKSWTIFFRGGEKTGWGWKIEPHLRMRMYELIIESLRSEGYKGPIALCKETYDMWKILKERGLLDNPGTPGIWENVKCNCKP